MSSLEGAVVLAAAILAAAGIAVNVWLVTRGFSRAVRVVGHETVDAILGRLGEVQLSVYDIGKDLANYRGELRGELDGIHRRLEYLEQRDRERPT
jgi:hypothetical protein